jgi:hypothetical protein
VLILVLALAWLVLLFLTFRPPMPRLERLILWVLLLAATGALVYVFLIRVFGYNPNPLRVDLAGRLTENKFIDLLEIVPGAYDLNYLQRVDTDWETEEIAQEWFAFYQYDVHENPQQKNYQARYQGPFGAAIYDYNGCRPPAILSYELIPVNYDYLGQDAATVGVDNIIKYDDPLSGLQDRPEVIVNGFTRGVVTDLNIFRKTGVQLDCYQWQQWRATHSNEAFPNPIRYENIGSFRGNHSISRNVDTVSVFDRAPFERSQITIRRDYRPLNGSYFRSGTQVLLDPVEYTLTFGAGRPDDIPQVYYPEKAVLAFYQSLTKDQNDLDRANSYLSPDAQDIFNIKTDPFGLAMPRSELAQVLVWEIRYEPNIEAERLHQTREVTVVVVGKNAAGDIDYAHPCQVTWEVLGVENPAALPYGCEWRLEGYRSNCVAGK